MSSSMVLLPLNRLTALMDNKAAWGEEISMSDPLGLTALIPREDLDKALPSAATDATRPILISHQRPPVKPGVSSSGAEVRINCLTQPTLMYNQICIAKSPYYDNMISSCNGPWRIYTHRTLKLHLDPFVQ